MKIIGLTGGIASGKSTVASILQKLGAHIFDADMAKATVLFPEAIPPVNPIIFITSLSAGIWHSK